MTRLPKVHDGLQQNAHKLFRTWREAHPSGLLLAVNGKRALWHSSSCLHFGDPKTNSEQWERSLTKRLKVLGGRVPDLRNWAFEHNLEARGCRHCMKEPHEPADPEDGFRLLRQQAVVIATEEEFARGPAPRVRTVIQRTIRDTQEAVEIKRLHRYRCQICGERIALPDGDYYAEAHHIRPLGSPHDGPDCRENILCLCPNHHVALDYRCFRIEKPKLRTHPDHRISGEHVAYITLSAPTSRAAKIILEDAGMPSLFHSEACPSMGSDRRKDPLSRLTN